MPLIIDGIVVPYAVEAGGRKAVEEYLADPDAYRAEVAAGEREEGLESLRKGLDALNADQVASQQRALGIGDSDIEGTGKDGAILKKDRIAAIIEHERRKE